MQRFAQTMLLCVLCSACAVDKAGLGNDELTEPLDDAAGGPVVTPPTPPRVDGSTPLVDAGGSVLADASSAPGDAGNATLTLSSNEVVANGPMAMDLMCAEPPSSPSFSWSGGPLNAASYVLAMVTHSNGLFAYTSVSWAVWDLPGTVRQLSKGAGTGLTLPDHPSAKQAAEPGLLIGGARNEGCSGTPQDYEFRLYALSIDALPKSFGTPSASNVVQWVEGSSVVLGRTVLRAHTP